MGEGTIENIFRVSGRIQTHDLCNAVMDAPTIQLDKRTHGDLDQWTGLLCVTGTICAEELS